MGAYIEAEIDRELPEFHSRLMLEFPRRAVEVRGQLAAIGSDGYADLLLDQRTNRIVSREPEEPHHERFVASGIPQLAACIRAFDAYARQVRQVFSEAEALALVDRLEEQIRDADPRALESPNTWWSCIVAQAKEGQL